MAKVRRAINKGAVTAKEVRSRMMASIKSKNTLPERQVRKMLHGLGFRFRLHSNHLPGKPDVVLPKHKLAIFVHGCFWHRHESCRFAVMPKTNQEFWSEKLNGNLRRDAAAIRQLHLLGWRTLIIWECAFKSERQLSKLPIRLAQLIPSRLRRGEIPLRRRLPSDQTSHSPR